MREISTKTRRKRAPFKLRPLTPAEKADCAAFARWNEEQNAARKARGERRFSTQRWEELTGVHRNTVGAYARGERPMPVEFQLDAAQHWRCPPQLIFPSWKWPSVTRVAPDDECMALVVQLLSRMRPSERTEAIWLLETYAGANKSLRARIAREVRKLFGDGAG